jgi:hypothetical protein
VFRGGCCAPGETCCVAQQADGSWAVECCGPGTQCNPAADVSEGGSLCGAPGLQAVPGGPYTIRRGGTVALDGSGSTPSDQIQSYVWTFSPVGSSDCAEGVSPRPGATKTGQRATIVALCSIRVTLTVSDGQSQSSASTMITVTPRNLGKVRFDQVGEGNADSANFAFAAQQLVFGFNRCRVEWRRSRNEGADDHWLHPGVDPRGTKGSVDLKRVSDAGGPFNGYWYVNDHKLRVTRALIVNRKLAPGGEVYDVNDGRYRGAIKRVLAATLDHERIHGVLAKEKLNSGGFDLVKKLERAMASGKPALLDRTNSLIRVAEGDLKQASSEGKVHDRMRRTWGRTRVTILVEGADGIYHRRSLVLSSVGDH